MSRKKRIAQSEHPYHATMRTNNKEFRFDKKDEQHEICKMFAEVLLTASDKYSVAVMHFVLMSSHFHMILKTPGKNISLFMQYVNARIAERINKLHNRTGHLWGERFKAAIVDTGIYMERVLRYIYNNPVRADIAKTSMDYEKSTIFFYAFGRPAFVKITGKDEYFLSLGETDEERRKKFVNHILGGQLSEHELNEIRIGMRSYAYGSESFREGINEKYISLASNGTVSADQCGVSTCDVHNLN